MSDINDRLPPEHVMRAMSKLALEQATEMLARMADDFAANPAMRLVDGSVALTTFAAAIRSTNAKRFEPEGKRQ